MTLSEKQALFTALVCELTLWINGHDGWRVRDGDCYRDARCEYGHPQSLHRIRLARDLILDRRDGEGVWHYQTETGAYRWAGRRWEGMHELARWGGRFTPADGNHFSLEHNGVR